MESVNDKIQEVAKKVVNKMVDKVMDEWPPQCATFYYQPVRPKKNGTAQSTCGNKKSSKNSYR